MEFFVICVSVGIETTPKAQPIPSVVAGNAGDWLTLSPFAIQFWVSGICASPSLPPPLPPLSGTYFDSVSPCSKLFMWLPFVSFSS